MTGPAGLDGSPYQGYLYAYPHKTAYRPLDPRPALRDVWAGEERDALHLYLHVPFCEARCGYCNLFASARPRAEQVTAYLRQIEIQADQVAQAIGPARFARAAIGGGTPTLLSADQLERLLATLTRAFRLHPRTVRLSVETSPETATAERMRVLAAHGTHRVSIGVQSFLEAETAEIGRPQRRDRVDQALGEIRASGVAVLNLDLIYGIPGQTPATWNESLRAALAWQPEEIYLYPLYVRPLTGLGRRADRAAATSAGGPPDRGWDGQRLDLYRRGRDLLTASGYRQLSMRHFRRADVPDPVTDYCCQDDGMVGLGCGARSYTNRLHYSFDYAVGVGAVRAITDDYLRRAAADFGYAEVGYWLDAVDQRLRWLVKTLLRAEGVDLTAFKARFATTLDVRAPYLADLIERGWAEVTADRMTLTSEGLARSDAIGPWLVSPATRTAMAATMPR